MTCGQPGYTALFRFADCQRRPWNSEKIEDFRQVEIVGRWSAAAEQKRDRGSRVHGVGVASCGRRIILRRQGRWTSCGSSATSRLYSSLGSPIRKVAKFPLTEVGAMVLSVNMSAVGDEAGAVLIIFETLPVPVDRRVWQEATTLHQAGYTVSVICPKGKGYDKA